MHAGFVVTGGPLQADACQVVALGTGTKCLSAQKRTCQVFLCCTCCESILLPSGPDGLIHQLARLTDHVLEMSVLRLSVGMQGNLINDSHAEVIARRALLVWLYSELDAAVVQVIDAAERSTACLCTCLQYCIQKPSTLMAVLIIAFTRLNIVSTLSYA